MENFKLITVFVFVLLNAAVLTKGRTLPKMFSLGSVEGKEFFAELEFPRYRNWEVAGEYCNSQGMKLASITSPTQMDFLKKAYHPKNFNGDYWTSGRDAHTLRQFSWDESEEEVSSEYLSMDNADIQPYSFCLMIHAEHVNWTRLHMMPCSQAVGVLCELKLEYDSYDT